MPEMTDVFGNDFSSNVTFDEREEVIGNCISTSSVAQEFGVPAATVHKMLAEDGYLAKYPSVPGTWVPTNKLDELPNSINLRRGCYAYVSSYRFMNSVTGVECTKRSLKWTGTGSIFLKHYLSSKFESSADASHVEGFNIVEELLKD